MARKLVEVTSAAARRLAMPWKWRFAVAGGRFAVGAFTAPVAACQAAGFWAVGLHVMRAWIGTVVLATALTACNSTPPHVSPSPGTHIEFQQLRERPLRPPQLSAGGSCPITPSVPIKFTAATVSAHGHWPFYFGPWGWPIDAGDFTKTPWHVAPDYAGRLVIRGQRLDGPGRVAFGFWPQGFGTPAASPDVPVLFTRPDQQGRTVVYQSELDLDTAIGGRDDGHFWSYPSAGCYVLQADGDTFASVTVVLVRH